MIQVQTSYFRVVEVTDTFSGERWPKVLLYKEGAFDYTGHEKPLGDIFSCCLFHPFQCILLHLSLTWKRLLSPFKLQILKVNS